MAKKKRKNDYSLIVIIPSIIVALIIFIVVYVVHSNNIRARQESAIKEDFQDKYQYSLERLGYKFEDDVYVNNSVRLSSFVDRNGNFNIEIRDDISHENMDLYLDTLNLFIDLDNEIIKDNIVSVLGNSIDTEHSAFNELDARNYVLAIHSYPPSNLLISIKFVMNSELSYKRYSASQNLIDNNLLVDDKTINKINISIHNDLVKRILSESIKLNKTGNISYDDIDIYAYSDFDNGYHVSYTRSNYKSKTLTFKIAHKYSELDEEIKKDLLLIDQYFKINTSEYYGEIIKFVDLDNKDFTMQEDYEKNKFYYGGKEISNNFNISVSKYDDYFDITYSYSDY